MIQLAQRPRHDPAGGGDRDGGGARVPAGARVHGGAGLPTSRGRSLPRRSPRSSRAERGLSAGRRHRLNATPRAVPAVRYHLRHEQAVRRRARSSRSGSGSGRTRASTGLRGSATTTAALLRARHVPVPLGRPAHGARRGVQRRRRDRPLPGDAGPQRAAPDRMGRVRPARRERRDQARHRPQGVDLREHRAAGARRSGGWGCRSTGPGACRPATPSTTAGPSGCSCGSSRRVSRTARTSPVNWCPQGPDRARERAGDPGRVRALRHDGRAPRPDPVVLQDHRLRAAPARRHGRR